MLGEKTGGGKVIPFKINDKREALRSLGIEELVTKGYAKFLDGENQEAILYFTVLKEKAVQHSIQSIIEHANYYLGLLSTIEIIDKEAPLLENERTLLVRSIRQMLSSLPGILSEEENISTLDLEHLEHRLSTTNSAVAKLRERMVEEN